MKLVALRELGDLLTGRLPAFLTRPSAHANRGGYLPVFTFHSLEPDDFAAKLEHLRRNRYRTLDLDEALACLRDDAAPPDRCVVLTIDDARLSTWTVAQPLLERFDMVATAFVIPGQTPEGVPRPVLGQPGFTALDEIDDRQTICNWAELAAMHERGCIRIESHTALHRRVLTRLDVDSFVTPAFRNHPYLIPRAIDAVTPWPLDAAATMLGAPLGPARPILAVDQAFDPPHEAVEACVELVRREGGRAFFDQPRAADALRRCWREHVPRDAAPRDTADAQRWELREARRILEDRLPGKTVRHFCYPESAVSPRTIDMLTDAGYASACWGLHDARVANRPGGSALHLGRLKHDYLLCLPGEGRTPLLTTLTRKARRRLTGRTGF